jgi:hypothetical protein
LVTIAHAEGDYCFRVQPNDARLIAQAPALLDRCKELREALAAALTVIANRDDRDNTITNALVTEIARRGIRTGIGARAEATIAAAEGTAVRTALATEPGDPIEPLEGPPF